MDFHNKYSQAFLCLLSFILLVANSSQMIADLLQFPEKADFVERKSIHFLCEIWDSPST